MSLMTLTIEVLVVQCGEKPEWSGLREWEVKELRQKVNNLSRMAGRMLAALVLSLLISNRNVHHVPGLALMCLACLTCLAWP